ncbi:hypothetical protein [Bradyrhizobium sp. 6(2017)]|uniref:hypothetical protein n=1 Tax=Bradyrhizobium sp. 6(2017) TaxID=1197460 RepID=UPI0013E1C41E|nr:hypothetical protein [Bradyrhizobium sp. 6(2017)]QIG97526.1 hypothetical protein G6P99_37555 [Bradyrhizobium sp. 6(2017)]
MVAADDIALEDQPLLKNALANWRAGRGSRKLTCVSCKLLFAGDDARAGGYLFAMPLNIDGLVSTSVFCDRCWRELPPADIEREATRVLRQLLPGGRFLDARP